MLVAIMSAVVMTGQGSHRCYKHKLVKLQPEIIKSQTIEVLPYLR